MSTRAVCSYRSGMNESGLVLCYYQMVIANTREDMHPRASAGGIVVNTEGKIALVEQHHNSWSFPKGGLEPGERELEAAVREIGEETGIKDLHLLCELGSYERYSLALDGKSENPDWGLRKRTFFLFTTSQSDFRTDPHDEEITAMRWVTLDEALALLSHPKDRAFLESVRSTIQSHTHVV